MSAPSASFVPTPEWIEHVERRIATVHNRDTVMHALYDVLCDGIDFGPRDLPTADDRQWLRGALAVPIHEATEVALHALVWHMAEAIERAPSTIRGRFERSHDGEELGWE
jgi:hypothetical protein